MTINSVVLTSYSCCGDTTADDTKFWEFNHTLPDGTYIQLLWHLDKDPFIALLQQSSYSWRVQIVGSYMLELNSYANTVTLSEFVS